jgi:hypothetical protein
LSGSINGALTNINSVASAGTFSNNILSLNTSGVSLSAIGGITLNPGSIQSTIISGSVYTPNIGAATSANILYYDTSTKQVTYGAAGTATSASYAATASLAPAYVPLAGGSMTGNLLGSGRTIQFQDLVLGYGTTFGTIKTDGTKYIGMYPTNGTESTRFLANGNVMHGTTFTDAGYRLQVSASGAVSGAFQAIGTSVFNGNAFYSGSIFVTASANTATVGQFVGNINGYSEFSVRNTNTGVSASGDIAVYADTGTVLNNYIDMGINNSGMSNTYFYGGTDFGDALDSYVYNVGGNLRIGNATSQAPYSQSLILFSNPSATPNIWITGSQVAIGKVLGNPINGSFDISGSTHITGSLRVSQGITGSLFGTSSWAASASWATNATNAATATNATSATGATNASNINIVNTTTGTGPYYPVFVNSTAGFNSPLIDSSTYVYNATTNTLTVTSSYAMMALSASWAPGGGGSGVGGSGTVGKIPVWTTTTNLSDSPIYMSSTNVGINIASPTYMLEVNGDIYAAQNVIAYSDQSVKENVTTITNAVNKVMAMRGVTFTRNDQKDKERIHAGVIAQEMEKAFPEVVFENENGTKAVAYANIVSVLIEAVKEQQAQIEDLRKQIEDLL